jgi:murein DD-endopeptidase MepM/ murein hydrolase activator NlpD
MEFAPLPRTENLTVNSRTLDARRALTIAALILLLTTISLTPAGARSQLETYHAQKRHIARTLTSVHRARHGRAVAIRRVMHRSTAILRQGPGRGKFANPRRWQHIRRQLKRERWEAQKRLNALDRTTLRTVQSLTIQRASINEWLGTWAVLQTCPLGGPHVVADNFGITVRLPGVPVHRHMGNDITAATGTPIVAPFPGYASASKGELGGLEVRVQGELGYVYNAHLSSYGQLGSVQTGDVIGYVGSTGDATVPHDHFEWHPNNGPAVDPNPYLSVSCEGSSVS